MAIKISRTFYYHDFPNPTLDDKITILEDRVIGWLTEPAHRVAEEIPHSGFAVLLILSNYFEMAAKFRDGICENAHSGKYFKEGIRWVFPEKMFTDAQCQLIWEELRNGLYHAGVTGPRAALDRNFPDPLSIEGSGDRMVLLVNPHTLPGRLESHFVSYVQRLRDRTEENLRTNFENRFDWLGTPKRMSTKH